MFNYFSSLPNNVSLPSLGMLLAGRQVIPKNSITNLADVGIGAPDLPKASSHNHGAHQSSPLLEMLVTDDTRDLLGMRRICEFSEPGADASEAAHESAVTQATGVPLAQQVEAGGHIRNRHQALAALKAFEEQRDARLPQLTAGRWHSATLSLGVVEFRNLADLLSTFPCAVTIPNEQAAGGTAPPNPARIFPITYPHGTGLLSAPRKACIGDHEVFVARDLSNVRRIRFSHDMQQWQPAGIYTDTVVEAEKLAMWTRIFNEALQRSAPPPAHD